MDHTHHKPGAGKALPLIQISKEGNFEVNMDAMTILQDLGDRKLAIIVIAGPYRSGKSFLANRLLGQMDGFHIGATTNACTKGIWMWSEPIHLNDDCDAILLDTEGLRSTERNTDLDFKIFSLAILLSSQFIFNSKGHIDENAMDDLSLVVNLTKHIHIYNTETESGIDFKNYFPSFTWVLRDFSLDLGMKTSKDYLEESLRPVPGLSEEVLQKNHIRNAITNFFKDRDCFTLVRPVIDEAKIAHIEDLKYEELRPEFRKAMENLVMKIVNRAVVKTVKGKPITASMFLGLAFEYVQSINNKEAPTVLSSLERVIMTEARKTSETIFQNQVLNLKEICQDKNLPMKQKDIDAIFEKNYKESVYSVHRKLHEILSTHEILNVHKGFIKKLYAEFEKLSKRNYEFSVSFCKAVFHKLYTTAEFPQITNIEDLKLTVASEYVNQWLSLLTEYKKNAVGPAKFDVLVEYIGDIKAVKELTENTNDDEEFDTDSIKVLGLFRDFIESLIHRYNNKKNQLKIQMNEVQGREKRLQAEKKKDDKILEEQKKENEELFNVKTDLDVKISKLERELRAKEKEYQSIISLKDMEIDKSKNLTESLVKEKDITISKLEEEINNYNNEISALTDKFRDLENEKFKETSGIQGQNKKLEEELDYIKKKVENNLKNPTFQAVNELFKQIRHYFDDFKKELEQLEQSKSYKMQLFELQRDLNEIDFQSNQQELQLRKEMNEKLRTLKSEQENELQIYQNELEGHRNNNYTLAEKMSALQKKVEGLNKSYDLLKSKNAEYTKKKETKKVEIEELKKKITENVEKTKLTEHATKEIETTIYKNSVDWKLKQDDKDLIIQLIPELIKAAKKEKNSAKLLLSRLSEDHSSIQDLLANLKIQIK